MQDTLLHPPPDTIAHCYDSTSCFSPGWPPWFSAKAFIFSIKAMNACDTTGAAYGGIKVAKKPIAYFEIDPNPGCVNEIITFTNLSIKGLNTNCVDNTIFFWDFGDGTTNTTYSLTDQTHQYSSPGMYIVKLDVYSESPNNCGTASFIDSVCINPIPSAGFVLSTLEECIPFVDSLNNLSNTINTCGPNYYNWDVKCSSVNCNPDCSWQFNSGDSLSIEPSFLINGSGHYTITLSVTNNCGTDSYVTNVDAKKSPEINLNPISDYCGATTINPSANFNDCLDNIFLYNWSFPCLV